MLSLIDPQDLFMCSDGISFLMRAKAETRTCLSDMEPHVRMYLFTRLYLYIYLFIYFFIYIFIYIYIYV